MLFEIGTIGIVRDQSSIEFQWSDLMLCAF